MKLIYVALLLVVLAISTTSAAEYGGSDANKEVTSRKITPFTDPSDTYLISIGKLFTDQIPFHGMVQIIPEKSRRYYAYGFVTDGDGFKVINEYFTILNDGSIFITIVTPQYGGHIENEGIRLTGIENKLENASFKDSIMLFPTVNAKHSDVAGIYKVNGKANFVNVRSNDIEWSGIISIIDSGIPYENKGNLAFIYTNIVNEKGGTLQFNTIGAIKNKSVDAIYDGFDGQKITINASFVSGRNIISIIRDHKINIANSDIKLSAQKIYK